MLAQKHLVANPITAKFKLGIDEPTATFLSSMSPLDIQRLSESGVCAIQFRFDESSLPHLNKYISGDDLALTQAVLGQGAN
jgi:hypothetical protein